MSPKSCLFYLLLMYSTLLICIVNMTPLPHANRSQGPKFRPAGDLVSDDKKYADVDKSADLLLTAGQHHMRVRRAGSLKPSTETLISNSPRANPSVNDSTTVRSQTTSSNASVNNTIVSAPKEPVWYSTAGWLPTKGIRPDRSVNLTVLPMLAIIFFLFGICIKCYSWVRDQDRTKARGQLDFEDDEVNYSIITAGEQGYKEVDFRSDTTSMYDTVNSFRHFRYPGNDHTVTSVKSLPAYDQHRSILIQKVEGGVYDTVQSYKAFLEHAMKTNDVDIEVELVSDYAPRRRSKSYDFAPSANLDDASKSRKRRMRRHSGGRSVEGNVKTQAERERRRRHSDKSPAYPPNPEPLRNKTFHRRSSPAILEPLVPGPGLLTHLEEDEVRDRAFPPLHVPVDRQSSNSSSTSRSSRGSRRRKEASQKLRRGRLRKNRSSQDRIAERLVKGSSHSSGHCSDDSPRSSCSSKGNSSNELESDSDVTDSGLVAEPEKSVPHSCFSHPTPKGQHKEVFNKRLQRFKVSFVDEGSLSAASSHDGDTQPLNETSQC